MAAVAIAVAMGTGSALAENAPEPLTRAELARCAERVQTLRQDGERLTARATQHDTRRAELDAEREAIGDSDTRRQRYNERATVFNSEVERFGEELATINAVRDRYHQECANRPYMRSDLDALPAEQREAMRADMDDVRIPFDGR